MLSVDGGLLTLLHFSPDNHHMGRPHGRSQAAVPLPFRYGDASLSSGPFSRWTRVRLYSRCLCSPQLQLWTWTGRATTHLPLVAQTCVFMSVNWDRTDPSRHSRDTQSVFHSSSSSKDTIWLIGFFAAAGWNIELKTWCWSWQKGPRLS